LVLEACHKVIGGAPFDDSGRDNPLLADFKKKVGGLKEFDEAARSKLTDEAKSALSNSVKPAYEKLIAFLEDQPGHGVQDRDAKNPRAPRESETCSLGAKFDVLQFHDVVLTNGALPLDVLEELVNRWIKSKQT
jgi:uncharacterized protein (DUF885 family)